LNKMAARLGLFFLCILSAFFLITFLSGLFLSLIVHAQPRQQNDLIFNPSGVPSVSFSQPRFADLDADGDLDLITGATPTCISSRMWAISPGRSRCKTSFVKTRSVTESWTLVKGRDS